MSAVWKPTNGDDLIERYVSGASIQQLAKESGVSRTTFGKFLARNNIGVRDRSEAAKERWRKEGPNAADRLCRAAWDASKGRQPTESERARAAKSRNRKPSPTSWREPLLVRVLADRGYAFVQQLVIGPHNVDIAHEATRLAVEVQRGDLCRSTSMRRKRIEHILRAGWDLIIAYCPSGRMWRTGVAYEFDFAAVADALISYLQGPGVDTSARGRYGMVGRDGERGAALKLDLNGLPVIPGF